MHRQRTAHRWRMVLTITACTFLAFGSFWLVQLMQRGDGKIKPDSTGNEPDYIVEKFSFVRMAPDGKPRYLFYGAKLTHRPVGDFSDVELPMLQSLAPDQSPMTIKSKMARIFHQQNQVDLFGKVDVNRPASATAQPMHLTTEALTVFPDEERMQSNQKVTMLMGSASITGTGMKANNATRQLEFSSRGQIVYPPKAAR